jgi:4-amino-4-deoxy-L-arabinose transferase-like glycosyltransferase
MSVGEDAHRDVAMADAGSPTGRVRSIARRDTRWVVAVGVVIIALGAAAARLPKLGSGQLNFDEGVYWLSMQSMASGHPLFSAVYSSQPPAFLLITEALWRLLGGGIVAARVVMLLWGMVGIAGGGLIGWRFGSPVAALSVAGILAVDAAMLQQSVILEADGPATSLAILSVALAACTLGPRRAISRDVAALAAGAALVVGLLTKLLDAAAVPVVAVTLLSASRRWRVSSLALIGGLLAAAVLLVPFLGTWSSLWHQVVGMHLPNGATAGASLTIPFLSFTAHRELPEIALAVLGMAIGWRTYPRLVWTGVVWVAGALAALAATHPVAQHQTVALSPGLALLGGAAVARIADWLRLHSPAPRAATVALMLCAGAVGVLVLAHGLMADLKPNTTPGLESSIDRLIPRGDQLLSDDQFEQAAADRLAPPNLVDTSLQRLHDSDLTPTSLEAAVASDDRLCGVLFATNRLITVSGFEPWVARHFPDRSILAGGTVMYRRARCS